MKVDVLAVIDRLIGNARTMAGLTGDPRMREHLAEGERARAAVAELIEALAPIDREVPRLTAEEHDRLRAAIAAVQP